MWKRFLALPVPGSILVLFAAVTCTTGALGEATVVDWNELVDQDAQVFHDPYRDLEPNQLIRLVTVARLREQVKKGAAIDEEQLSRETGSLTADGIDVDALIAQRWVVAKKREHASTAGNKTVDSRNVLLAGFVIPAPADADGIATAYLVPERGMCSHMPPPAPNQMIRLRLFNDWKPQAIYEPVRIAGRLVIDPTSRTVRVVDGLVRMRATFSIDVATIETQAGTVTQARTPDLPSHASTVLGEK